MSKASVICRRDQPTGVDATAWGAQLPPLLRELYHRRGICSDAELSCELSELPAPEMLGLDDGAAVLDEALRAGRRILVLGDYDADGATACTLVVSALRAFGAEAVEYMVPNRFSDGYGLCPEVLPRLLARNPDLVITVDNGITAVDAAAQLATAGVSLVITDHHLAGPELPTAAAIINPNQPGCPFPAKSLAGVGVAFYLMAALRARLRRREHFTADRVEPAMTDYLDLVAVGTVADMVPLEQANRILVHQGLQRIRAGRARPGIDELLRIGGRLPGRVVASDLSFGVAPLLNAAGRLDDIGIGIDCLLSTELSAAREIATRLRGLNQRRRRIEAGMQREAQRALAALERAEQQQGAALPWGLCLCRDDFHAGVIGLLAARLKERHHRPVFVLAPVDGGLLRGSGRSIPGFHLRDALAEIDVLQPGLMQRFGGHAAAAGLTMEHAGLAHFEAAFDAVARRHLDADDLRAVVWSDGELTASAFNLETARQLRYAGPWGQRFPEPVFDGCFRVLRSRALGQKGEHFRLSLEPEAGGPVVEGVLFRAAERGLNGKQFPQRLRAAYQLDLNEFRGRKGCSWCWSGWRRWGRFSGVCGWESHSITERGTWGLDGWMIRSQKGRL